MTRRSGFDPKDLERARAILRGLPFDINTALTTALDSAAESIAERARVLAPKDTGALRGAIKVRKSLEGFVGTGAVGNFARLAKGKSGLFTRYIGVFPRKRGDAGWYAAWVEFGTGPRFTKKGKYVGARAATPFLGPAFFGGRKQAESKVRRAIGKAAREIVHRRRGIVQTLPGGFTRARPR